MLLIGYIHRRKSPVGLNRAYAFAAVAMAEGQELLYFSPGAVDFQKRLINGYVYRGGRWVNTVSRYPDVICNIVPFSKDTQIQAADRLKAEIPFTSFSMGNKFAVYKNLTRYKKFADYLVPTVNLPGPESVFAFLGRYPEAVLKPAAGHKGENVCYIRKAGGSFRLISGGEEAEIGADELLAFVAEKLGEEKYIIQPYINCRTKTGEPYDLRLHVQKNGLGRWVIVSVYPRISLNGNIACNLSRGGCSMELEDFLEREFGKESRDIRKRIEMFALQLAAHMDEIQRELHGEELDELGIDVGLGKERQIYIYEVNWRPGAPFLLHIDLSVIQNKIRYAMLLAGREDANP